MLRELNRQKSRHDSPNFITQKTSCAQKQDGQQHLEIIIRSMVVISRLSGQKQPLDFNFL